MTTLEAPPAPAVGVMEDRWATTVWLGTIQPAVDHELLRTQMRRTTHGRRQVDAGDILDAAQACVVLSTLAQTIQLEAAEPAPVRLSVQIWAAGYRVPLAYGHGPWSAWCCLATVGDALQERSGALCLHDPRAGCDAAAVPGLPWGRALAVQAQPGLAVLAPGWLARSVLPVTPGHTVAVLTAEATHP
ncbi:hypothetical protein AB0H07_40395 [Streptomyces sp. NPDC021354]|uniref:hypothetical protein n=1 Tax=Streptomyces sp. NPDC021354 TaxID=3154793 RepID=UPI003407A3A8